MTAILFLLCPLPLTEKIEEIYKAFIQESGIQFSELEQQVLHFHLSNLEYACGSSLHQVWLASVKRVRACVCVRVCACVLTRTSHLSTELPTGLGKQETMVLLLKRSKTMTSEHINPTVV